MDFWCGKGTLVTGAGGFIGSHLAERLVKSGAKTRVFVRYNSRNDWGLIECLPEDIRNSLEIFVGDLKDPEAVRKAVKGCETAFHLGALIAIPYSYVNPLDFVQTNIMGTANVLNACRDYGVEKLIHTSTSEVYGTAQYTPIDEDHPLQGQSPYSASKIGADKLAESYHRTFDLPVAVIRPFNTYGPRQSARAIIPTVIAQLLLGETIELGSLEPTRDLNYIDDTVEGFVKIAESECSVGQVINVGTGKAISIKELVERIVSIMGKEVEVKQNPARIRPEMSEVKELICDNTKAKSVINWEPKTSLDEGLKKTIDWISQNQCRYKAKMYNL